MLERVDCSGSWPHSLQRFAIPSAKSVAVCNHFLLHSCAMRVGVPSGHCGPQAWKHWALPLLWGHIASKVDTVAAYKLLYHEAALTSLLEVTFPLSLTKQCSSEPFDSSTMATVLRTACECEHADISTPASSFEGLQIWHALASRRNEALCMPGHQNGWMLVGKLSEQLKCCRCLPGGLVSRGRVRGAGRGCGPGAGGLGRPPPAVAALRRRSRLRHTRQGCVRSRLVVMVPLTFRTELVEGCCTPSAE